MLGKLRLKLAKLICPKPKPGSPFPPKIKEELKEAAVKKQDEFKRAYNSPSGVDCKLTLNGKQCVTVQSVAFGYHHNIEISDWLLEQVKDNNAFNSEYVGTMKFIMFDNKDQIEILSHLGKVINLELRYATEYGDIGTFFKGEVMFDMFEIFGLGIDDIVSEFTINFVVLNRELSSE